MHVDETVPPSQASVQGPCTNGVNSLPAEILSRVFVLGSETSPEDDDEPESDEDPTESSTAHFATLCSHVCRHWRNVAIETPQLWACIDFQDPCPFEKSREWISRSKAVPLTLEIDHEEGDQDISTIDDASVMETFGINTIVSLIMPHAHRWCSLEIAADRYNVIRLWELQLENCPATPKLEYLSLFCHEETNDLEHFLPAMHRGPRSIFHSGAPNLNTLILWGVHIDWETAPFLNNLKCLQLAYHAKDVRPSVEQFVRILERSRNIEDLSLEGSAPVIGDWPQRCISVNCLQKLSLVGIDAAIAREVVGHLVFPALRDLTLDLDQDDSPEEFITAACKGESPLFRDIEAIKLTTLPCDQAAATKFLSSMPNIISMTLNFNFLSEHFFDALVQGSVGSKAICQRLHILKLSGLDGKKIHRLITARNNSRDVLSIQQLYLDQDDGLDAYTAHWLRSNVELLDFFEHSDHVDESDDESLSDSEE